MSRPRWQVSTSSRFTLAALGLLASALFATGWLYQRIGVPAIATERAVSEFRRAVWLAGEVQAALDPGEQPGEASSSVLKRIAEQEDVAVVLLRDGDVPIQAAYGVSRARAMRRFARRDAPGSVDDASGDWVPTFPDLADPDRFRARTERPVFVQDRWPFAVEAPVGQALTLRVVPLTGDPSPGAGFGTALWVLGLTFGLVVVLVGGRFARPYERAAIDAAMLARRPSHRLGKTRIAELDALAATTQAIAERLRRSKDQGRRIAESVAANLTTAAADALTEAEQLEQADGAAPAALIGRVRKLAALVEDLAAWTDLELERSRLSTEPHSPHALIERCVEAARASVGEIALDLDPLADEPIRVDASLLGIALRHVLRNAAAYGAAPIRVSTRRSASRIEIAVSDAGPGVADPALLPRVFDPFQRGPGAEGDGLGLGLRIARQIVELHQGGIGARNLPEGGFEVRLWLPAPLIRVASQSEPSRPAWALPQSSDDGLDLVQSVIPAPPEPASTPGPTGGGTYQGDGAEQTTTWSRRPVAPPDPPRDDPYEPF